MAAQATSLHRASRARRKRSWTKQRPNLSMRLNSRRQRRQRRRRRRRRRRRMLEATQCVSANSMQRRVTSLLRRIFASTRTRRRRSTLQFCQSLRRPLFACLIYALPPLLVIVLYVCSCVKCMFDVAKCVDVFKIYVSKSNSEQRLLQA